MMRTLLVPLLQGLWLDGLTKNHYFWNPLAAQ